VHGDVSQAQARAAGGAFIEGVEETARRRQIALSVRTV
jgi:hypothetical protein